MAPAAVHIGQVKESLRSDFEVAAQNCWVKGGGAFTGELRWACPTLYAFQGCCWPISLPCVAQ